LLYFLPFVLVAILSLAQIYLSNRLATYGRNLKLIEKEIALIEERNSQVKSETASRGGLAKLEDMALEKGFNKNPMVKNLSSKVPVALNP